MKSLWSFLFTRLAVPVLLALAFVAITPVRGAAITWNGSGDDLWSNSANWTGGAPELNDIYFNNAGASATAGGVTSIVDQAYTINSLSFSNTQYHLLQLPADAKLSVTGGISVGEKTNGTSLVFSGSGSDVVAADAALGNGTLNLKNGTTLRISNSMFIGKLHNYGYSSGAGINLEPGAGLIIGSPAKAANLYLGAAYGSARASGTLSLDSTSNPNAALYLNILNVGGWEWDGSAGPADGTLDLSKFTGHLEVGCLKVGERGYGRVTLGNPSTPSISIQGLTLGNGNLRIDPGTTLAVTGDTHMGYAHRSGQNSVSSLNLQQGASIVFGSSAKPVNLYLGAAYLSPRSSCSLAIDSTQSPNSALYLNTLNVGGWAWDGWGGPADGTLDLTKFTGPLEVGFLKVGERGYGRVTLGNTSTPSITIQGLTLGNGNLRIESGTTLAVTGTSHLGYAHRSGQNSVSSVDLQQGASIVFGSPVKPVNLYLGAAYLSPRSSCLLAIDSTQSPNSGFFLEDLYVGGWIWDGFGGPADGTLDISKFTGPFHVNDLIIGQTGIGHFIFGNDTCNNLSVSSTNIMQGDLTVNKRSTFAVANTISISSSGSMAIHVGSVAGGLSIENASNSALSLVSGASRIVIDFDDPDTRIPNYYGFRWKGDHVAYLQSKLNQYGFTGDGGIRIVANGNFVKNATLQISLGSLDGQNYTYLGFNAEPNTQVPLAGATHLDPAYLDGISSLPSPDTRVWSLELRQGAQLNMNSGDRLTAPGGVFVDPQATINAQGTIDGNVRNSGAMGIGSASVTGACDVLNNFTQASSGSLLFKLGGNEKGVTYDHLHVTGSATIEGLVTASLINGFQSVNHSKFDVLTADGGIVWGGGGVSFNLPAGFTWSLVDENKTLQLSYDLYGEIAVEQPAGQVLSSGTSTIVHGALAIGTNNSKTYTVRNTGGIPLSLPSVTVIGDDAADFVVSNEGTSASVLPGEHTTFTVAFAPAGTVSSPRTATLRIVNDDPDENPFDIVLSGQAFSTTADVDGDGLNDWDEFRNAAHGFDWQTAQPTLVNVYLAGANASGLYTPAQVQAMNLDAPLIERDPNTGEFILTIGLEKSTDLIHYSSFPVTMPQATITPEGKLRLRFSVPDNAAFFRVEAR